MATQVDSFREYPNPRPLGYVPSDLDDAPDTETLRVKILEFTERSRYAVCRGFLEAYPDTITPEGLQVLLDILPELLCDDTAEILLNSGNLQGVEFLMSKGWVLTQIMADAISDCIKAYSNDPPEQIESHYRPVVNWLQQHEMKISM